MKDNNMKKITTNELYFILICLAKYENFKEQEYKQIMPIFNVDDDIMLETLNTINKLKTIIDKLYDIYFDETYEKTDI